MLVASFGVIEAAIDDERSHREDPLRYLYVLPLLIAFGILTGDFRRLLGRGPPHE